MQTLTIRPILGEKINVPQNDPTMLQWIGENQVLTHAVYMNHMDLTRQENACSKAYGKFQWSSSAISGATGCNGLFELDDGTNVDHIILDHGKFYYYNSSRAPTNVDAATPVTFNTTSPALYSLIQYGDWIVIADGLRTPYVWKHGEANLYKLIDGGGTEYVFKYLIEFQRRIIGIYSDQSNGDIEIRWTDDLPTLHGASLDFASANQLYKPQASDPFTGVSKMGANAVYFYGEESICRLDYYPGSKIPFGITQTVTGHGSVNHHSIINDGLANYFFDKNYGFVKYQGEYEIKKENIISLDIQSTIEDISSNYQNLIVGTYLPFTYEICWSIPISSTTNNKFIFYNTRTGQWRTQNFVASYLDYWTPFTSYTWTNLDTAYSTWTAADAAVGNWGILTKQLPYLVFATTNGHLYTNSGEDNNGTDLTAERLEPILDFREPDIKKRILEIWFSFVGGKTASINDLKVMLKSGDAPHLLTTYLLTPTIDTSVGDVVIYIDKTARYHQLYWYRRGDDQFSVSEIRIKYQLQGTY